MDEEQAAADVIVIGAGPVGMTAALLLARRGVRVSLIERNTGPSTEPKAISIDDESLRTLVQAGVGDRMRSIVSPGTGTLYVGADGEPLFHARGPEPYRLGFPFKNPFAQPELERALAEAVAGTPQIAVSYGTVVDAVDIEGDLVSVGLHDGSRRRHTRAASLIGADGGRSIVREQLGIRMSGRSYPDIWLVLDALHDSHDERYGIHVGDPARPHVIVPGAAGRCRYEFLLLPGEGEPGRPPEFDLLQRLVAPYRTIERADVERAVVYRFHALTAERWRVGPAFLAGDAAHMMPPFAGQGLNSGIRDVANLTWKLAGVLDGSLAPSVLDSYEQERQPQATATVRFSERLGRVVMTTSPTMARRRDSMVRSALGSRRGREHLEAMRYRPAAGITRGLVIGSGREVGVMLPQPRVFDTVEPGVRGLDDLLGDGWAVIGSGVAADAWERSESIPTVMGARRLQVPAPDRGGETISGTTAILDVDGALDRAMAPYLGGFLLVRPDRIVAAAWRPHEADAVRHQLERWMVRRPALRHTTSERHTQ